MEEWSDQPLVPAQLLLLNLPVFYQRSGCLGVQVFHERSKTYLLQTQRFSVTLHDWFSRCPSHRSKLLSYKCVDFAWWFWRFVHASCLSFFKSILLDFSILLSFDAILREFKESAHVAMGQNNSEPLYDDWVYIAFHYMQWGGLVISKRVPLLDSELSSSVVFANPGRKKQHVEDRMMTKKMPIAVQKYRHVQQVRKELSKAGVSSAPLEEGKRIPGHLPLESLQASDGWYLKRESHILGVVFIVMYGLCPLSNVDKWLEILSQSHAISNHQRR